MVVLKTRNYSRAIVLGLCLFVAGCGGGDDLKLTDLSGKVTFAGKPVAYGQIEFVPDTAKGHKGPAGEAEIVEGAYDTSRDGKGIVPGAHQIRITAYEEKPAPANPDETVASTSKPPLFMKFVFNEELKDKSKDFEIPESARGFGLQGNRPAGPRPGDP